MFIDNIDKETFMQSLIFALRTKAQKLRVDKGSIVAIGLVPCDEQTETWLDSEGCRSLIMAATSAKEKYSIKADYVENMGSIPKTMLQAKKRRTLLKKKEGSAAFYRPLYRNSDEDDPFLEVYAYVRCGDAEKANEIAANITATIDDWLSAK